MKKLAKITGWVVTGFLVLAIAGLAFIRLVPGYAFSVVRSGSMVPALNVGDVIITGPAGESIKPGTVVMFTHGKDNITHRVLANNTGTLVTKGDANEDPDPWQTNMSNVKGAYLFKLPLIGYVLNFVKTKTGWFLSIIIPTAALIGWLCWDILKEAFKNDAKSAKATVSTGEAEDA